MSSDTKTSSWLDTSVPPAGVSLYADDFVVRVYDWKAEANERIEQIRKRDVQLLIVDTAGGGFVTLSTAKC